MSGRRRLRTFGWPASAAVAVALLVPAAAPAQERTVETATNGTVTAELSYVKRERGRGRFRFDEYRDFRVKVTRAGAVLYDQPVGDPCDQFCTPTETALTREHVALRDLNADGEPEAIVGLFTGGANCCVLVLAYGYDAAANVYRRARLDTGGGYVARDHGARRGDRARGRRLPLPRPVHLRRLRLAADPHLALRAAPLRGRHRGLPREDPLARPAACGASTRACGHATRPPSSRARSHRCRRPVPARPLRRGLPPGAGGDPARRARPPLALRRLPARTRVPARPEALPAPRPAISARPSVAAEALLDAPHLVVERLVRDGRGARRA